MLWLREVLYDTEKPPHIERGNFNNYINLCFQFSAHKCVGDFILGGAIVSMWYLILTSKKGCVLQFYFRRFKFPLTLFYAWNSKAIDIISEPIGTFTHARADAGGGGWKIGFNTNHKGTFPRARSGCGADPGRRPLKAAARGCTFPLRRIRSGTVADPPGLVINIYLQLISLHDGAVGVTDLGVMLLWSSADKGIWPI